MGAVKLVIGKPWIVIFFIILNFESNDHKALKAQIIRMAMMTNQKGASGGTKITTAVALVTLLHLERAKGFFLWCEYFQIC